MNPLQPVHQLDKRVHGPAVLLMGLEGTGKTDSIRTLIEAGLKVFVVFSEPGMEVLIDPSRGRKVYSCADGLHWRYIPVAQPSWDDLRMAADHLNKFSFKMLANEAATGRERFRAFYEIVDTMGALRCQRCNQNFGPADQLEPYKDWAVVNDSLTSISKAALYLHIGVKPAVDKGEYGICMFNIERYLDKFVGDIPCLKLMTAHIDWEPDSVQGGEQNMVATLGQKLAPKIPRPFSDVLLAKRKGGTFTWSTVEERYRLKTRNFPFSADIPPSFVPLVQKWHQRIRDEEAAREASKETAKVAALPGAKQ
jgi:hypothetical protein